MEHFRVFVSSTSLDLRAERQAVADVLRKSGLVPIAMEDWDARPADATTVSLDGINNCEIFVGIYAFRYGFIPQGSSSSITEQEYELARREGKRCLCYFKDEAVAASLDNDPELAEPEFKRRLLATFKQRVEKELVRAVFTTPEDLATKLAIDVSHLQRGYLPGYSRRDLLRRWAERGIDTRSRLIQGALSGHTNLLPSPVLPSWSNFIGATAWHEVVANGLRSISELAGKLPKLFDLSERASRLAIRLAGGDESQTPLNYHTVLAELDKTITDRDVNQAEKLKQELRRQVEARTRTIPNPYPDAGEMLQLTRRLLRELRNIRESLKRPSFKKCFPVIGSLGSGRTHFIATLLGSTPDYASENPLDPSDRWCDNDNFLVLLLNHTSNKPLEETILDGINQASGFKWQTLEEFDRFLSGKYTENEKRPQIRLCIAIDDLQRWLHNRNNSSDELIQFVEAHTHLSSLFWLFTLQDTSYSQVQNLNPFLKNYSHFQTDIEPELSREARLRRTAESKLSHVSGWLALDDLNREQEFGLKLIEKGLEREGGSLPSLKLLRQNQSVLRNLIKPFVACVLLDLHSQGKLNLERLATLSYMSFVTEFWNKRKDDFISEYNRLRSGGSQDAGYDDWSQALKLVAETLSQTGEFNPLHKDLETSVVQAARKQNYPAPEQMVAAALAALTKSGFLKRYAAGDPQMPEYEVQKIGFEFEPFWQLRLADHIRAWQSFRQLDQTAAKDELVNWFGVVESSEIEEGVLEFLLLLMDSGTGNDKLKRDFVSFLQQSAIESPELPEEAVWFSGANATLEAQVTLMKMVVGRGANALADHRLLHSIMYFLVEALPAVSEPADRFKILQPHYGAIGRDSLSAYFLYAARRLLTQATDNTAVRRAMPYLSQSETMGIAENLALLTVNVLFRKAEDEFEELNAEALESVASIVLDYLQQSGAEAKAEYEGTKRDKPWQRYFYREWVLRHFCSRLVQEIGAGAYHLLERLHWYAPEKLNISWPILSEMRREANLALGDWYRMRRTERRESYLELIRRLINDTDSRKRAIAFFLIRHSEATRRKKAVLVDADFAPMLEQIFLDPKLTRVVSQYRDLFEVNLPDFRKLEALRKTKLTQENESDRRPRRR